MRHHPSHRLRTLHWLLLVLGIIPFAMGCAPNLKRFATEQEIYALHGQEMPPEPETRWLELDPVYEEPIRVAYWDNQREDALGTVVFVHGIPNNKRTFLYLWHALGERFRVVAYDAPGFGFSTKPTLREAFPPEDVYSANTLGYFLVNFIDCIERDDARRRLEAGLPEAPSAFEGISLIGNSYGCAGIVAAYTQMPQIARRIDQMVLISPAVYYQRVLETSRLRRLLSGFTLIDPLVRGLRLDEQIAVSSYQRIFWQDTLPDNPQRYRIPREQLSEVFEILNEPNFYYVLRQFNRNINPWNYDRLVETIQRIQEPTLVVAGLHDEIVPNILPRRLVNDMPNAQLVVFENSGHQPHLEEIFETNRVVEEWLVSQIEAEAEPTTAPAE